MIIIQVAGGLGNQMQQYALYRKLQSTGRECKLDIGWFQDGKTQEKIFMKRDLELTRFKNLPMDVCTTEEKKTIYGSDSIFGKAKRKLFSKHMHFAESKMYHPEIFELKEGYITGYFACEKYYADILPELRKDFVFPDSANREIREKNRVIREKMKNDPYSVSIHIRRGDYLAPENAAILGGISTPEYYAGAVREVRKKMYEASGEGKLTFYVFSDDSSYAKTLHFGEEEEENIVIDWNRDEDNLLDMEVMRHARAVICANSTFSFWGARLNGREDKITVRPSSHRNNQVTDGSTMQDYWKGWILIDKEGNLFV